jgi:hypothetical protein
VPELNSELQVEKDPGYSQFSPLATA